MLVTTNGSPQRELPYAARAFTPAHGDLPRSLGVPAQLANERYVEALARVVYYWGYPAVETFGRTNMWELMKAGPGMLFGILPGAPVNMTAYAADYLAPAQRWLVTPNTDTLYGVGFANLALEPAVIQTPTHAPRGHYWTIQIVDVFTNVIHQLGSAASTPGGKFLLVGPDWTGQKPDGFIGVLRVPTNVVGVFPRSFAPRTPEGKARGRAVLGQIGMYPLSANRAGERNFDVEAIARNAVFPPGVTASMIAADPEAGRPQWVNPRTFWDELSKMLDANPSVGPDDRVMADQARTLIARRASDAVYRTMLDRAALEADADLRASSSYAQVGVDVGNGWQRQEHAGSWQDDWFSRAQAAVIYLFVSDYREACHFVRGTDSKGALLDGRHSYRVTFGRESLPPVDRARGGFWSLTLYDKDYFLMAKPPNGRTSIGSVLIDASEIEFDARGSLTLHISAERPTEREATANWLPAPHDTFALMVRAYVPTQQILDGSYRLPNVERVR